MTRRTNHQKRLELSWNIENINKLIRELQADQLYIHDESLSYHQNRKAIQNLQKSMVDVTKAIDSLR